MMLKVICDYTGQPVRDHAILAAEIFWALWIIVVIAEIVYFGFIRKP